VSILQRCPSRPLAICGLLFFEGLIDEGAQPGARVEAPLGAEALEPLTGFGRDADRKRYTAQHKDTQQHMEQQSYYKATRGTHTHREREKALNGLPARDHCGESDPAKRGG